MGTGADPVNIAKLAIEKAKKEGFTTVSPSTQRAVDMTDVTVGDEGLVGQGTAGRLGS